MKIVLLTWLCGPWAHVTNWVVLGSFTPRLYSGTLISLLIGLNDFANSDIRFSYPLPPGELWHYRWSLASLEDSADTPRCFSRPCAHCLAVPDHRQSPWITSLPLVPSYPVAPLITRCTLRCFENPLCLLLCGFFLHYGWFTEPIYPQLFMCFTNSLEYYSIYR